MASHPYISGAGNLAQMVNQLRDNLPRTITSETVKKLGLAPNNESYVINALQFIGVIGEDGKPTPKGTEVFSKHNDQEFQKGFEALVREAYSDLFDVRGNKAWDLSFDDLISYFRNVDKTSAVIGQRQAKVFQTFAALAGHASQESNTSATAKPKSSRPAAAEKKPKKTSSKPEVLGNGGGAGQNKTDKPDFALTVRIEINLPANGTRENYDDIFKSIKENLMP